MKLKAEEKLLLCAVDLKMPETTALARDCIVLLAAVDGERQNRYFRQDPSEITCQQSVDKTRKKAQCHLGLL